MTASRRRLLASAALVPCCLLGGCRYVADRVGDLLDPFRFAVGVGPGLYADVRVTDFAATGLGYCDMTAAGMNGRHAFSDADLAGAGVGLLVSQSLRIQSGWSLVPGDSSQPDPMLGDAMQLLIVLPLGAGRCDAYSLSDRGLRVADVRAGVALGYVGLDVGFSPGEFVDLLLGFVGIDIAGDDAAGREPAPATEPEPVDPAARAAKR